MRIAILKVYMARVFSAVDIENSEVLDELEHVRDSIDLGFNTVPAGKMHVTLQFFEEVDSRQIEEIKEAMDEVSVRPFNAEIAGLGAFPSRDYIRVVWAGAEAKELHQLYREVSSHSIDSNNDHDFTPHITLARVKNISPQKKKKLQKSLEEYSNHDFGTVKVDKVRLFESKLTGQGSKYELIHEAEL